MKGTTGLASWSTTGPAQTIATSAAIGIEPMEPTASRHPPNAVSGRARRAIGGSHRAAMIATSMPIRIGARNSPKPPSRPMSSVSFRTAATIAAMSASAIEFERPVARRTGEHQSGGELEGGGAQDEKGRGQGHGELIEDAGQRLARIETQLRRCLERDEPEQER